VTEHLSKHIVNVRKLCRTLPGQSNLFCANSKYCALPVEGSGGLVAVLQVRKISRVWMWEGSICFYIQLLLESFHFHPSMWT